MSTLSNLSMTRRQFLGTAAAGAGVFVLGISLPGCAKVDEQGEGVINAFIGIDENGVVTFQNPFIEMGQGTYTSIPAIMAEELDADMAMLKVVQAPHGPEYRIMFNNTTRFTGGSFSVRSSYMTMRKAGATARAMLIEAAAGTWRVPPGECTTEPGVVIHRESGKKMTYGELAPLAAKLDIPADVPLKDDASFRLIGKPIKRTDNRVKATGEAEFGIDIKADGLLYAAVKQSPVFGGSVQSYDQDAVLKMPGVVAVEEIPNGVAVIADQYWRAKKALEQLPVTFDEGDNADFSSKSYLEKLKAALNESGVRVENVGDADKALSEAAKTIEAVYHAPFLAHQTMEPMNCTALVTKDHCKVWAPNQGADFVAKVAAEITGLKLDAIEVITPFLGGGFGRRFIMDYTAQAVTLAKKLPGKPIKVIWTREEDTQHDHYRPMTAAKYRAGFDAQGNPLAIQITTAGEGPSGRLNPEFLKDPTIDESIFEGGPHQPYAIPNKRAELVNVTVKPVPIGYWRSVGNSQNAFFKESFIDEMAHAAGADPVEFRRNLLTEQPRFKKVLDTAAGMANWKSEAWKDENGIKHAMGVALHESFGSIVAQVAEVAVDDGDIRVVRVWCAVDCGFAVNPAIVKMQMESGIVYGLSAAWSEEITLEKGRVTQSNFHDYPILRPDQMPAVDVEIINSGEPLGGIGEPGTPPIAPAVCNALFKLTGQRVRSLPLSKYTF
ncbi:xanthine dehydrogenase family protein molybdopterin-binding subunit [Methylotuvimicrobium alcaliphilum]|uniref:Oxidoreductase, molybdenum cofactor binding subunit n=1 Tax=Methylotuvimicrobium alcaliphilum (strain DSM 19304 / NCIMB 14124 / VKM B-2133 / 20Z) TaxID=1091494 RepID=G4STD2_META2|nr:xanthine dehydrogenase family protein molybdopterin-binding subunit [Methylotuvimicrobium alcaliphilum]CCE23885.1 putative oxidoreductase, molybdenum cofactor binding subunit [Methylotuvimicrobium alcaliphilum 20Z]